MNDNVQIIAWAVRCYDTDAIEEMVLRRGLISQYYEHRPDEFEIIPLTKYKEAS